MLLCLFLFSSCSRNEYLFKYFILIISVGGVICFNIRDNQLVDYQAKIRELEKVARWEMITKNVVSFFESEEIFDKSDAVFFFIFNF